MMTRKDFKAISEVIRPLYIAAKTEEEKHMLSVLVLDLSKYFRQSNNSFDSQKFYRACGFYQEG